MKYRKMKKNPQFSRFLFGFCVEMKIQVGKRFNFAEIVAQSKLKCPGGNNLDFSQ